MRGVDGRPSRHLASADGEAQCLQSTITITRTDGTTFTRHIKDYDVNH
jgi:hypothetical protein